MATTESVRGRPSTEDICRQAADKLSHIHVRSCKEEEGALPLGEMTHDRPPPYSEVPVILPIQREVDPAHSFLVPPPPPPSPGDALKVDTSHDHRHYSPIPSAPPAPLTSPLGQDHLMPHGTVATYNQASQPLPNNQLLQPPTVLAGGPTTVHHPLGPSPVHSYTVHPACSTTVQPQLPTTEVRSQPYPSPQAVMASTPILVQPPPPPPPPPPPSLPPSVVQSNNQVTNNQNVNVNANQNMNNVNVNVEAGGCYRKRRRYPNYLSFSIILCLLCWIIDPIVYICIIPALVCSCYSCTANTYRKSRFGGKWAFSCNLTALVCGLLSFAILILPLIIVFSMASVGAIVLGDLFKDGMNESNQTNVSNMSDSKVPIIFPTEIFFDYSD